MTHTHIGRGGLRVAQFRHGGVEEYVFTAVPADGEPLSALIDRAVGAASKAGATVVRQDVFGTSNSKKSGGASANADWPVTWLVEGADLGMKLTGCQVMAVRGATVRPIRVDNRVVGSVYESADARYAVLGDLHVPHDQTGTPRAVQTEAVFDVMLEALAQAGMTFANVVRTWFYLDRILDWYGDFNAVRTAFFRRHRVFDGLVPASTGVGGGNVEGAAIVAQALAVQPVNTDVVVEAVPSPLQCPALQYGSSFSRAVEVRTPRCRRLLVSGTASIEPGGRTAHVGDAESQTELTMQVVEAILRSRGMAWGDVVRGIAYVKCPADAALFGRHLTAVAVGNIPVVLAENDICRDDLLVEIEVDAVRTA